MSSFLRAAFWTGILFFLGVDALSAQCMRPSARPAPGPAPSPGVTPVPSAIPGGGATPGGSGVSCGVTRISASWELWWLNNADPYLSVMRDWYGRPEATDSANYSLGRGDLLPAPDPGRAIREGGIAPALLRCRGEDSPAIQEAALLALAKVGGSQAFGAISKHLSDGEARMQVAAVVALGVLADERGVEILLEILNDTKKGKRLLATGEIRPELRAYAAIGLGLGGSERAVPALIGATRADEPTPDVAAAATQALGFLCRPEVGEHLVRLFGDESRHELVRAQAVVSLGKIGDQSATPRILRALYDPSLHVNRSAVVALGLLGPNSQQSGSVARALSAIVLRDSDLQFRGWACIALGQIRGEVAERTLVTALVDERPSLQAFAGLGLGLLLREEENTRLRESLRRAFAGAKQRSLQGALVVALGLARDIESQRALSEVAVSSVDSTLRGYAILSLGMIKAHSSAPLLRQIMQENRDNSLLVGPCALALGLMGDRTPIPQLARMLERSSTEQVRGSSAIALGHIGDVSAIVPLQNVILRNRGDDQPARVQAVTALGILGDRRVLSAFFPLRKDSNYAARVPSMSALLRRL